MILGYAMFDLVAVNYPEEMESYEVERGDTLLVPPMVAHRVRYRTDSIVVVCNDKPYLSAEHDDASFDFSSFVATSLHHLQR